MKKRSLKLLFLFSLIGVLLVAAGYYAISVRSESPSSDKEPSVIQAGGEYKTSDNVSFTTPEGWYLYTGNFISSNVFFLTPEGDLKFLDSYGLENAYRKDHIMVSTFSLYIQKGENEVPTLASPEEFIKWQVDYLGEGIDLEKINVEGRTWYRWITPSGLEFEGDDNLVLVYYLPYSEDKLLRISLYPATKVVEDSPNYDKFINIVESIKF